MIRCAARAPVKDGLSWYFAQFNRNKRSIRLDLRKPEAKAILARLIERSDVLVENFRPGVLARMGFDDDRLKALRPSAGDLLDQRVRQLRAVQGPPGVRLHRPGHERVHERQRRCRTIRRCAPGCRSAIWSPGCMRRFSIAACVPRARATGQGQRAEVSLTNGLVSLLAYIATNYFATGTAPARSGNDHPIAAPYGLFPTRDGQIALAPADDAFFRRLADALGEPGLKTDPLYATQAARVANRARINAIVGGKLAANTTAYWVETLNRAGVPCGPVNSVAEVFEDPQILAQEMVMDVEHPGYGIVRMLGFPIKLSETPCRVRRSAPRLGEHSDEILAELGYAASERAALRRNGVI